MRRQFNLIDRSPQQYFEGDIVMIPAEKNVFACSMRKWVVAKAFHTLYGWRYQLIQNGNVINEFNPIHMDLIFRWGDTDEVPRV